MKRRIKECSIPGLGQVRLQSLTASEGLEVEFQSVTADGKPNPRAPAALVAAMWLDIDTGIPRCRDVSDLEDMDYAVFQLLYEACVSHRDYISPQQLVKNLPSGEGASPLTESWSGQTRPASTDGSTPSVNVSFANGEHLPQSEQRNNKQCGATSVKEAK